MQSIAEINPESRRAARRAVTLSCEVITSRWDRPVQSECSDLSPYGMWIETTFPLKEGDDIMLNFCPPRRDVELTLFAKVRHVDDRLVLERGASGVGLEFENVTVWEAQILRSALKGLPPHLPGDRTGDRTGNRTGHRTGHRTSN